MMHSDTLDTFNAADHIWKNRFEYNEAGRRIWGSPYESDLSRSMREAGSNEKRLAKIDALVEQGVDLNTPKPSIEEDPDMLGHRSEMFSPFTRLTRKYGIEMAEGLHARGLRPSEGELVMNMVALDEASGDLREPGAIMGDIDRLAKLGVKAGDPEKETFEAMQAMISPEPAKNDAARVSRVEEITAGLSERDVTNFALRHNRDTMVNATLWMVHYVAEQRETALEVPQTEDEGEKSWSDTLQEERDMMLDTLNARSVASALEAARTRDLPKLPRYTQDTSRAFLEEGELTALTETAIDADFRQNISDQVALGLDLNAGLKAGGKSSIEIVESSLMRVSSGITMDIDLEDTEAHPEATRRIGEMVKTLKGHGALDQEGFAKEAKDERVKAAAARRLEVASAKAEAKAAAPKGKGEETR